MKVFEKLRRECMLVFVNDKNYHDVCLSLISYLFADHYISEEELKKLSHFFSSPAFIDPAKKREMNEDLLAAFIGDFCSAMELSEQKKEEAMETTPRVLATKGPWFVHESMLPMAAEYPTDFKEKAIRFMNEMKVYQVIFLIMRFIKGDIQNEAEVKIIKKRYHRTEKEPIFGGYYVYNPFHDLLTNDEISRPILKKSFRITKEERERFEKHGISETAVSEYGFDRENRLMEHITWGTREKEQNRDIYCWMAPDNICIFTHNYSGFPLTTMVIMNYQNDLIAETITISMGYEYGSKGFAINIRRRKIAFDQECVRQSNTESVIFREKEPHPLEGEAAKYLSQYGYGKALYDINDKGEIERLHSSSCGGNGERIFPVYDLPLKKQKDTSIQSTRWRKPILREENDQ